MNGNNLLRSFLVWRLKYLSIKNLLLILSVLIGAVAGSIAVGLHYAIHYIHTLLTTDIETKGFNYLYFVYPVCGIFLTVIFVHFIARRTFDHGITNVLYSISKNNSIVRLKDTFYFILSSLTTVGFGGSVGLEATLVMSGSGLGSNLARVLHLSYRSRMLLLGCGVAGALSAFFHAPIAGVIFALEILMLDLTMASLIPLLVSSIMGIIMSRLLVGSEIMFHFSFNDPFGVQDIPFYIMLGIFTGLIATYFIKIEDFVEVWMDKIKNFYVKTILGALGLGTIIMLFPPLYGEGYAAIEKILAGESEGLMRHSLLDDLSPSHLTFLMYLACIVLLKAFAVALTMNSGGIGGFFAPSLFLGALSGFFFASMMNYIGMPVELSETNFMLVGMAGAMSGIFHSPLTAVFLIAELARGYQLIVPLMVVSTVSYMLNIYFEPHSMFTRKLAKKGELITHHKDKAVLTLLELNKVLEKDLKSVSPEDTLGQLLTDAVSKSNRNIFPVLDKENHLIGVVQLDDIRDIMFKPEMYDRVRVKDIMTLPHTYITLDEPMDSVIQKFDFSGDWNLPVIDENSKYVGFVSKSKLFSAYRRLMIQFSEE